MKAAARANASRGCTVMSTGLDDVVFSAKVPAITAPEADFSAATRFFSSSTNTRVSLDADPMLATRLIATCSFPITLAPMATPISPTFGMALVLYVCERKRKAVYLLDCSLRLCIFADFATYAVYAFGDCHRKESKDREECTLKPA